MDLHKERLNIREQGLKFLALNRLTGDELDKMFDRMYNIGFYKGRLEGENYVRTDRTEDWKVGRR